MPARLLSLVAVATVALAGCGGKTVNADSVEQRLADHLSQQFGQKPELKCPDDEKAEKGTKFTCDGNLRRQKFKVDITMTAEDKFTFKIQQ